MASFVVCLIVAFLSPTHAELEPPSTPELCTVELFQSGYGITRGSLSKDFNKTGDRTLQIVDDVQKSGSSISTSKASRLWPIASLSMKVVVEVRGSERVGWVIPIVGLALLALAQAAILYLGRLPPPRVSQLESSRYPAASVFVYTGIVRVGFMANYTVILPFAASLSISSGQGSDDSGYLIAVTSAGAMAGLIPFWLFSVQRLRLAYICHGVIMFLGNSCLAWAAQMRSFALLVIARLFVGVEAAVAYNTTISTAHHAKGDALTTCCFAHQLCQDVGVLIGPVVAALATSTVKACGSTNMQLQEGAGNLLMALWGILLVVALLLTGPLPDPPEDEEALHTDRGGSDVQAQGEDAPEGAMCSEDPEGKSDGRDNVFGLQLFITEAAYLRHVQRLLFESGMIYMLQMRYQWSAELSGLVMLPTIGYCVLVQVIFAVGFKGTLSDKSLIFIFELKQLVGCLLMVLSARSQSNVPVGLILGGMITYGGNSLSGAGTIALCAKRAIPGSIASGDALMMGNMVGCLSGCFVGALASRVLLGESPSPYFFALLMLGSCCCQFIVAFLTLEIAEFEGDRRHVALVLGVAGIGVACAILLF